MPPKKQKKKRGPDEDLWDDDEPKELYSEYGHSEDAYDSGGDYY